MKEHLLRAPLCLCEHVYRAPVLRSARSQSHLWDSAVLHGRGRDAAHCDAYECSLSFSVSVVLNY